MKCAPVHLLQRASTRQGANHRTLSAVLYRCSLECPDLPDVQCSEELLTLEAAEKVVGWATSSALNRQHPAPPATAEPGGPLLLEGSDLEAGLGVLQALAAEGSAPQPGRLKGLVAANEFETKILSELVAPEDVGVSFEDIGALEKVKEVLREVVMLPLQRPELFKRGALTKPTKGVLLFGPPGGCVDKSQCLCGRYLCGAQGVQAGGWCWRCSLEEVVASDVTDQADQGRVAVWAARWVC